MGIKKLEDDEDESIEDDYSYENTMPEEKEIESMFAMDNGFSSKLRHPRKSFLKFRKQKSGRNRILSRKLSELLFMSQRENEELQAMDKIIDSKIRGGGILASPADIDMDEDLFAEGCKLLLGCARGDLNMIERLLKENPSHLNFRDYDRRTALHVAASEGHLELVEYLVKKGAKINRSDRWGGSPLDDAHRHQQEKVAAFLRENGGSTGSADQTSYLFASVAEGDIDETMMLLDDGNVDVRESDYDDRTPLHLACRNGNLVIARALICAGAEINARDGLGRTPLDDAIDSGDDELEDYLIKQGAVNGIPKTNYIRKISDVSNRDLTLSIDVSEVEMIERIGSGAFGEIYKCQWKGTLVAAKCIKSAKIQKEWLAKQTISNEDEYDVFAPSLTASQVEEALKDFRQEIAILSKVRHPNICMLLGFTTTEDHEVMISELMKCSLLDIFKANMEQEGELTTKAKLSYANQLAKGMHYLHTFKQPIIHRDLKPANLLIDFSGTLKITDFGLAKVRPTPDQFSHQDKFLMTGETGSYRYMAPEVFRHEQYTEKVDVYSYAMILYYIFDGIPPWPYISGLRAVEMATFDGARPAVSPDWHIQITALIQKCWDENPSARPSFAVILDLLNAYSYDIFGKDCNSLNFESERSIPKQSCCVVS